MVVKGIPRNVSWSNWVLSFLTSRVAVKHELILSASSVLCACVIISMYASTCLCMCENVSVCFSLSIMRSGPRHVKWPEAC